MDNYDSYHNYVWTGWNELDLEAQNRISEITPDLFTYMNELNENLITGAWSLDDWDDYMAELKRLGLDEVLAIYDEYALEF